MGYPKTESNGMGREKNRNRADYFDLPKFGDTEMFSVVWVGIDKGSSVQFCWASDLKLYFSPILLGFPMFSVL